MDGGRTRAAWALATVLAIVPGIARPGIMRTRAGGLSGEIDALSMPTDRGHVSFDVHGNAYLTHMRANRVWKIDTRGVAIVIAGFGGQGFSGDGGPATSARLYFPMSAAADAAGNVFIADANNARIRRVDAVTGVITTFASVYDPQGVAVGPDGNLYVATRNANAVLRIDPSGAATVVAGSGGSGFSGDGGPATQATVSGPTDVGLDGAGNLYIYDSGNFRIRKVDAATGVISTVVGNGQYSAAECVEGGPATNPCVYINGEVEADAAGNLFVSDPFNGRVRAVDAATGAIFTVAGTGTVYQYSGDGGPATQARLYFAASIALTPAGELVISDGFRLRKVDGNGIISTWAGNGRPVYGVNGFFGDGVPATSAALDIPATYPGAVGTTVDGGGNLLIADMMNNQIRRVDAVTGVITTIAGTGVQSYSGDGGPAVYASLYLPTSVTMDGAGNLYVSERSHRIRKIDAAGTITTVAGNGSAGYCGDGGPAVQACLYEPRDVAADQAGNLYFPDMYRSIVRRVDAATGVITTFAGIGSSGYGGDGGPASQAMLAGPSGVEVDAAGNVFIAESGSCRVRKVSPAGVITTVAGGVCSTTLYGDGGPAVGAALGNPQDIAVDGAGNLFIADAGSNRIRRVDAVTGVITVFAGGGSAQGGLGDGGLALSAVLFAPSSVSIGPNGSLFVTDRDSHRIREVYAIEGSFTVAPDRGFRDQVFAFDASSNTSGVEYSWAFGDGSSATGASASHAYAASGIYTVSLTTLLAGTSETSTTTRTDAVCAGYIFSWAPETATTAPFTREYSSGGRLYGRVWALPSDVDTTRLKSATLTVSTGRKSVSAPLVHEGNGIFSGSVLIDPKLATGSGSASFRIADRDGRTYEATETITVK